MLQQQTECDYELLFNSRIYHVVQLCFFFPNFIVQAHHCSMSINTIVNLESKELL